MAHYHFRTEPSVRRPTQRELRSSPGKGARSLPEGGHPQGGAQPGLYIVRKSFSDVSATAWQCAV
jgi:hypothetical protein